MASNKQRILRKEKEKLDAIKSEIAKEVASTINAPETSEQKKSRLDKDALNRRVSQITDAYKKRNEDEKSNEQLGSLSYGPDGQPYTPTSENMVPVPSYTLSLIHI